MEYLPLISNIPPLYFKGSVCHEQCSFCCRKTVRSVSVIFMSHQDGIFKLRSSNDGMVFSMFSVVSLYLRCDIAVMQFNYDPLSGSVFSVKMFFVSSLDIRWQWWQLCSSFTRFLCISLPCTWVSSVMIETQTFFTVFHPCWFRFSAFRNGPIIREWRWLHIY